MFVFPISDDFFWHTCIRRSSLIPATTASRLIMPKIDDFFEPCSSWQKAGSLKYSNLSHEKKNILLLSLQFRMAYEIIPTYLANLLCTQNNQTRGPFFSLLTCMSHLTSYLGWLLDWTNDLEKLQPKHQWLRVYVSVALVTIQHWGGHFATRCFFVGGVTSKSFRVMGEKPVTSYHYHASESLWSWNWKTKMTR